MIWNVIRIVLLIWIVRVIYKWYSAYREMERRKVYNAGRRSASRQPNRVHDDHDDEYIDYEEIK
jgi:hypothetical protein